MKKIVYILFIIALLLPVARLQAQGISRIETASGWYHIYNKSGKKVRSLSTSEGQLVGYSSTFFILRKGNTYYITYNEEGARLHLFTVSSVGEIQGVADDTFTSRLDAWIFTWSKDGRKISTKAAK